MEIASILGLPKGTAHNIIRTLERNRFLQQDEETRKYSLGSKIFTLGTIMSGTLEINQKGAGPAQKLANKTDLVSRIAIWDQDAALISIEQHPHTSQLLSPRIGPRVAAYCSAIGRAILAYLPQSEIDAYFNKTSLTPFTEKTMTSRDQIIEELKNTRSRGYAINNEELTLGRASIASPIFKGAGRVAGAISLTWLRDRKINVETDILIHDLRTTAGEISEYLGYYPTIPEEVRTFNRLNR